VTAHRVTILPGGASDVMAVCEACFWKKRFPDPVTPADLWRAEQDHLWSALTAAFAAAERAGIITGVGTLVPEPPRRCPDAGRCHHGCTWGCWRVGNCGPSSGVYEDDEWPVDVYALNSASDGHI
jgi:hypothetical protein